MKIKIFIIISFILFHNINAKDKVSELKLIIKGLRSSEGVVRIALANNKQTFESYHDAYLGAVASIKNNNAEFIFENIPFGYYAVKVFHDEDNNNTLTTNFLGIPIEDYGFSNNARALIGIPSWEKAKFYFDETIKQVIVQVK